MAFDANTAKPLTNFDANTAKAATAAPKVEPAAAGSGGDADAGALYAAIHGFADTATFGQGDKAAAALSSAVSGRPYSGELAGIKDTAAASENAHPAANFVGNAIGLVTGAGAVGKVAKAAESIPFLGKGAKVVNNVAALKKGQTAGNIARSATAGGSLAVADVAGHGGSEDQMITAGAAGAVAGPVLGAVGAKVVKTFQGASAKAMQLLADKLGESPADLQNAFTNFQRQTGRPPSMAEIVGLKTAGELRMVAADNPTIGEALASKVQAADTAQPQRSLTGNAAANAPEDINSLTTRRKERMDTAMNSIRDTPVPLDSSHLPMLADKRVRAATNGDPELQGKVRAAIGDLDTSAGGSGSHAGLTVDDFDSIRKSLRGRQASYANPQASNHNPHTAESYGKLAEQFTGPATRAEPGYKTALDQFKQDSDYIAGFKHGNAGKAVADASKPDLIKSLDTPEGKLGYTSGSQEAQASDTLKSITPGSVKPAAPTNVGQAAGAVASAAYHSPAGVLYHMGRIFGGSLKMSEPAQRKVAKMLTDPNQTMAGIAALRKAGIKNDQLRQLSLSISGATGVNAGEATQ